MRARRGVGDLFGLAAIVLVAIASGAAAAAESGGEDGSPVVLGGLGPTVMKPIIPEVVGGVSATVRLGYAFPGGFVPWVGASGARWLTRTQPTFWEVSGMGGVRQRFLTGNERPWAELAVGYGRFHNDGYIVQPGLRFGFAFGVDWAVADVGWLGVYAGADLNNQLSGIWGPYAWAGAGVSFTVRVHGLRR